MLRIFKRSEPPQPIYKRKPIATIAVILTILGIVFTPVGVIYEGMSEDLKKLEEEKVDNKTLQLMIEKDRDALKRNEVKNKEQDKALVENQKAIHLLLREQAVMKAKKSNSGVSAPKNVVSIMKEKKIALTPEEFEKYISLKPEIRVLYKKYLEDIGKDTSGLPE